MSPRVTGAKTRQAILVLGGTPDPYEAPERLELFDQYGDPINLASSVGIPPGGADNQILAKASAGDYDVDWVDPTVSGIPPGGTVDQVLAKLSGTDFDAAWVNRRGYIPSIVKTFDDFTGWTFDTGAAADWALSGGKATKTIVGSEVLRVTGSSIIDGKAVLKFRYLGISGSNNPDVNVMFRWLGVNDQLFINCFQGGGNTTLAIQKKDGGSFSVLQSYFLSGNLLTAGNDYWIVVRWYGNRIRAELWAEDPRKVKALGGFEKVAQNNSQNPTLMSVDHALVSGNATKFGAGIAGGVGVGTGAPGPNAIAFDEFVSGGYVPVIADDF